MSAPPVRRRRSRRQLPRAGLVVISCLAVLSSIHSGAANAAELKSDPAWKAPKIQPVHATVDKILPPLVDNGAKLDVTNSRTVNWPAATTAEAQVLTATEVGGLPLSGGQVRGPVPAAELAKGKAGSLPVWTVAPTTGATGLTTATTGDVPSRVKVQSLGRQGDQFVLKLGRSDGVKKAGRVGLQVGYEQFRYAYGGDWALRLKMFQVPACAIAAQAAGKAQPAGCALQPLRTRNDGSGTLSADVPVTADGATMGTFVVQATAASGAGDFKASSLMPSATWSVGGSAGDFNWTYPMQVPPATGGPVAKVDLGYSSGSVDGRTSATNNQPSWVGEGFELAPGGTIERRYASCGSKSEQSGNNGTSLTGDLCWATDNATFTLNGKGGELVRDDTSGKFHPRNDDGSTIEHLTGAVNGDEGPTPGTAEGEYWVMTAKDGTKYYFGLNHLPGYDQAPVGTKQETNSTWNVPVFGNNVNEPCKKSTFAASWCHQAYKWNLDYVVDRNGNTMSLFYDTETNNYARAGNATTVSTYTRAGNISRIEYGQQDGKVFTSNATAKVVFSTAPRCVPGSACGTADYPDTPLDQECTSTTNCPNKFNPTFWTKKRLTNVTTQVWRQSENKFGDVQAWTLRQSFRDPGDNTKPALWLEAISNAGLVGTSPQSTPEVNFNSIQLANRVDPVGDAQPPMNWLRVSGIEYGSGGRIAVEYSLPDCKPGDVPAPDTNGRRCHPMKWTPDGGTERTDWFHKYVVTKVTESDRLATTEPMITEVEYVGQPAWRHDDEDGLVEIGQKTWSQWRGYDDVIVRKGNATGTQSITESRYFRGMDGDQKADGTFKDVQVTDSEGTKVEDSVALAGQLREQSIFDGKKLVDRTITDQWVSKPTATRTKSWATTSAYEVQQAGNKQVQTVAGGALRTNKANNIYDDNGVLTASNDENNIDDLNDDTCTLYDYTKNDALGIEEIPKQKIQVSVACGKPYTKEQVIGGSRTYYDNATSIDAAPTKANPTKTERLSGFDPNGNAKYEVQSTMQYDALGRGITSTDAMNQPTTTTYTPAGAGPVTRTVVTKPGGQTTTTDLEPAWGEEVAVTDQAGRHTEAMYDSLGRTMKVWLPGRAGSAAAVSKVAGSAFTADNAAIPNMEYKYDIAPAGGPSVVTTRSLQTDGSVSESLELSDGMLRPRQTQEPASGGGRLVSETRYDSRGLAIKQNSPFYVDGWPVPEVVNPVESELPTQKIITYDGAERPVLEQYVSRNQVKWVTKHDNSADHQTVTPPQGDQPTTRVLDVQGRLTELRQFKGATASGDDFDKTSYSYNAAGKIASVTDPAGNQWKWEYDLQGRKTKEIDPDKGPTIYTYNALDQVTTTTDNRNVTVETTYDVAGRKTAELEVPKSGSKRLINEWTYDQTPITDTPGAIANGSPSTATHWVGGKAYVSRITGYDNSGKVLGTEITIPDNEGSLAKTYEFANTYNADGEMATASMPAIGGLPAETLQYGYDDEDQPNTLQSNVNTYVRGTTYTAFGQVESLRLGTNGGKEVEQDFEYEIGTQRLSRVVTKRETAPARISDVNYGYDAAGNIKKVTDAPSTTSGQPTDTQCFNYDNLRRLTSAWTPAAGDCTVAPTKDNLGGPAPYWHSWTFDQTGNRKSETRTGPLGTSTAIYAYPATGQARPHAVQSVGTTGPNGTTTDTYGYDESGNLASRSLNGVAETFNWDAEGELEKVSSASKTTQYVNDADGERLIRRDSAGVTLYLPGGNEVLLKPNGSLEGTRYYKHGEQTIAVRIGGNDVTWLGADHHGTATTAIDNTAAQNVQRRRTDPYGNNRGAAPAAWPGQRGFVGGTNDPSTGLVHLGAREYDPTLGRFISVDPEANYEDPQTINGYSYANNNPVTFTDPDGTNWFTNIVSSTVSAIKTVAETVVSRTVETVRSVVDTVVPIFNWVKDQVSNAVEQVKTMVHKAVEVVKKVVKTVVKVVKKAIKTVTKVAKVVTKKVASFAKETAKKALRNTQAALKAGKNWNDNLSKKITAFYHSDTFKSVLHVAASLTAGILAGVVAGALCGPAALICAAAGSAALGGVFGAALNTGVAAATGEQITAEKVGGWALSNMVPSILSGPRAATKTGWLDVAVSATTKLSGGWGINTGFKASFGKLVDPSRWTLSGRDVPFGGFLPRK